MKSLLPAILLLILFSCRIEHGNERQKYFALLPLGDFTREELEGIQKSVNHSLPIHFLVLEPEHMPADTQHQKRQPWLADSLLIFVSSLINDSIMKVAGFTREDIYTLKKQSYTGNDIPPMPFAPRSIFGLSYVSGNAAIISTHGIYSTDRSLLQNRTAKVFMHELGHTLGVKECKSADCIMYEANGTMAYLNKAGGRFCDKCAKRIQRNIHRL